LYGCSIVEDDSHASCEAYFQDWYLKGGTCLSHGIHGRGQSFLFVFNELEGRGVGSFFTHWNMGWTLGHCEWAIWKGAARRSKLGALLEQNVFCVG
jgi:hypothetical protein